MLKIKNYWLMKSEPLSYSIQDLQKSGKDWWDGVRNYQARNFMKNNMQIGDEVLFYHSNSKPSGIVGLATISQNAEADITAFDSKSQYYDPKSQSQNPKWFCVEVSFKSIFKKIIPLAELREHQQLSQMLLLKKGQRLSIMPIKKEEYKYILNMSQ